MRRQISLLWCWLLISAGMVCAGDRLGGPTPSDWVRKEPVLGVDAAAGNRQPHSMPAQGGGNKPGLVEPPPPPQPEYRIKTGDILTIAIPYESETKMSVPVRPDGRISYLFNIETRAAGLTYKELHAALIKELSLLYKTPRVSVLGKSFAGNSVFVMGPVKQPGSHEIHNRSRLLDVLSNAGVLSVIPQLLDNNEPREIIDLNGCYVARGNQVLKVNFRELIMGRDMRQNILLQPQDFIFIANGEATGFRKKVFVCGHVNTPKVFWFSGEGSYVEAVVDAGGPIDNVANLRNCYLIRKGEAEPIRVDYASIVMGRKPDIALEHGDILYLPERQLRYGSKVATTVIRELLSPLQAVLDGDDLVKEFEKRKHLR